MKGGLACLLEVCFLFSATFIFAWPSAARADVREARPFSSGDTVIVAPAGRGQGRVAVRPEPGTAVVATTVLVATGSADEDAAQAGLAYLAARSAVAPIRPTLDSLGVHLSIQADKDALLFTLVAAPQVWEEASRTLLLALFRDPIARATVEQERRSIRAELTGREANPADALTREVDTALFGTDHPWSRSEVGYARTVEDLSVADVDAFLRRHFSSDEALTAVVGPVDPEAAARHLLPFFSFRGETTPVAPPAAPALDPVRRHYNSITAWLAVSYPLPPNADVEAVRFLADLVTQSLAFGPTQRSVYDVEAEVHSRAGASEVRFQMVVPPGEAELWASRIREAAERLATESMPETTFQTRLRHYRGNRLLEMSAPEGRAEALARSLLGAESVDPLTEFADLSPARLQRAARALGDPVVVFLGPTFAEEADAPNER